MFVAVEGDNAAALQLYRRAGFRQVSELAPRLFLRKSLRSEEPT